MPGVPHLEGAHGPWKSELWRRGPFPPWGPMRLGPLAMCQSIPGGCYEGILVPLSERAQPSTSTAPATPVSDCFLPWPLTDGTPTDVFPQGISLDAAFLYKRASNS